MPSKEKRQRLKRKGLCVTCGVRSVEKTERTCPLCREKCKERRDKIAREARGKGLCPRCNKRPIPDGLSRCEVCMKSHRLSSRQNQIHIRMYILNFLEMRHGKRGCTKCSRTEDDGISLEIDHINNDGMTDRRLSNPTSVSGRYRRIADQIESGVDVSINLQLLCGPSGCNREKADNRRRIGEELLRRSEVGEVFKQYEVDMIVKEALDKQRAELTQQKEIDLCGFY